MESVSLEFMFISLDRKRSRNEIMKAYSLMTFHNELFT